MASCISYSIRDLVISTDTSNVGFLLLGMRVNCTGPTPVILMTVTTRLQRRLMSGSLKSLASDPRVPNHCFVRSIGDTSRGYWLEGWPSRYKCRLFSERTQERRMRQARTCMDGSTSGKKSDRIISARLLQWIVWFSMS
jgi:hypothetical protein